jgi:hydrogenase-4 component B
MKAGMALLAFLVVIFGIGAGFIIPLILGISRSALGIQQADIPVYLISVLPPAIAAALFISAAAVFLWFKFGLRGKAVSYNTWDCGYYTLDSRNEYTATAFSKPFRIAFSFFLRPYRESQKIRDSFYHVREFTYSTHTTPVFRRYFYQPLLRLVYRTAYAMRKIQPGSIHLYILYIFAALAGLLAVAAIF